MNVHYNIHVYGKVQGVGFRYSVRNFALQNELNGFVRNLGDGSVYIEIEGNREACSAFIAWCKRGPGFSRVDDVVVNSSDMVDYSEFRVRS